MGMLFPHARSRHRWHCHLRVSCHYQFVPLPSTTTACPKCSKATAFKPNKNVPFGWEFWCVNFQLLSRQQARHLHVSSRWLCTGAVPATHNTWFVKRAIHFPVRGTHILLAEQPGCDEGVHDSWLQRSHCCQPHHVPEQSRLQSQKAPPATFMEHLPATKALRHGGHSFVVVAVSSRLNCSKISLNMAHFTQMSSEKCISLWRSLSELQYSMSHLKWGYDCSTVFPRHFYGTVKYTLN